LYKSNPRRWMGVETSWMAAGATNWAVLVRAPSVLRILENFDWIAGGRSTSFGAMMDGRLNEAKIVKLSRTAKRAYESFGTTAAAVDEAGAPNIRAKQESLYTQRLIFTDDVATNLAAPDDTADAGLDNAVDVRVSTALAVA
jgi:hypothetical protein